MGERKVLNRYVPPDFDPSIIPRFKRDKNRVMEVRTMLPFSMRCNSCGEYMGRGKKFNSRKEDCKGEDYMGIRRFRFIVKCSVCSAEISFKTDPKNTDYEVEYGATRNYEMWTENAAILSEEEQKREEEESTDAMKSLENRTLDSKIEMDVLDALDEIKAINQRHERVDTEALLDVRAKALAAKEAAINGLTEADELLVKNASFASKKCKRLSDSDSEEEMGGKGSNTSTDPMSANGSTGAKVPVDLRAAVTSKVQNTSSIAPVIIKKKKRKAPSSSSTTTTITTTSSVASGVTKDLSDTSGTSNSGGSGSSSGVKAVKRAVGDDVSTGGSASGVGVLGGLLADYGGDSSDDN